jgi:WD repeat, SAM and U-box domain-containing protein 1
VTCCVFSSDNNLLATGSNDKTVIVWNLKRSKLVSKQSTECCSEKEALCNQNINSEVNNFANNFQTVAQWSVEQVSTWLESLGLDQYIERFKKNKIDGRELLHLSQDMLLTHLKIGKVTKKKSFSSLDQSLC